MKTRLPIQTCRVCVLLLSASLAARRHARAGAPDCSKTARSVTHLEMWTFHGSPTTSPRRLTTSEGRAFGYPLPIPRGCGLRLNGGVLFILGDMPRTKTARDGCTGMV